MQFEGKHAEMTAETIVRLFARVDDLVNVLAMVFMCRRLSAPCRKWAWHNQVLVLLGDTQDARSMESWNKSGRSVKKGSRAIWILTTITNKSVSEDGNGNPVHISTVEGFRSVPVFAFEDTVGKESGENEPYDYDWLKGLPLEELLHRLYKEGTSYGKRGTTHQRQSPVMLAKSLVDAAYMQITSEENTAWDSELVRELGATVLLTCVGIEHKADYRYFAQQLQKECRDKPKPDFQTCLTILNHTCRSLELIISLVESPAEKVPA